MHVSYMTNTLRENTASPGNAREEMQALSFRKPADGWLSPTYHVTPTCPPLGPQPGLSLGEGARKGSPVKDATNWQLGSEDLTLLLPEHLNTCDGCHQPWQLLL